MYKYDNNSMLLSKHNSTEIGMMSYKTMSADDNEL
jgi:hypothetical protein